MSSDARHIVLLGPMGVGKTTVGALLAGHTGMRFVDSDAVITDQRGRTGADIAASEGVGSLHRIELDVFVAMAADDVSAVLAPGASVVDTERGRQVCGDHWCVVLSADDETLDERRGSGHHRRVMHAVQARALAASRTAHHRSVGDLVIDTTHRDPQTIVSEIIAARA